jgi:hypothetical protein
MRQLQVASRDGKWEEMSKLVIESQTMCKLVSHVRSQ